MPKFLGRLLYVFLHPLLGADEQFMKLLEDKIVNVIPMLKKLQILDHPDEEEYA
jgi:hypothetical protein